ncbi:SGNH/GDSL hydrolase family protein [Tateyamaria omphalii]|uniref:SGNH/GDSL hydrolase family protein n=1 Tax=Tateyamaria omphalii TaxID=299262 RepID=UPI001C99AF8A|nr:SGNH/GDSL hydrolase family protein [Tateyamaria omphalii]MBY5935416.1 SGNH/GDSL hydrolase family protein [Tateyamaria omphalii]
MRIWVFLAACLALFACTEPVPSSGKARIIATGDSMLAWNAGSDRSVVSVLERRLGAQIVDRSVVGARYHYVLPVSGSLGLRIGSQYRSGPWDWVIMNGGGNDLWLGCGCRKCEAQLDRLIAEDGSSGTVVTAVKRARADGARVAYVGYLRTPGRGSIIDHCRSWGNRFEARLARMATRDAGVTFVSVADLVPHGDLSFHDVDRIHPSPKGSAAIAARIAAVLRPNAR